MFQVTQNTINKKVGNILGYVSFKNVNSLILFEPDFTRKTNRQNFDYLAFHKSNFSFNISNISFLMNETGLQCTLLYLTHDNSNCTTKKTAYLSIFAILCNKALNLQPNTERNKKQQYLHTSQIIQVVGLLNDSIVFCNY